MTFLNCLIPVTDSGFPEGLVASIPGAFTVGQQRHILRNAAFSLCRSGLGAGKSLYSQAMKFPSPKTWPVHRNQSCWSLVGPSMAWSSVRGWALPSRRPMGQQELKQLGLKAASGPAGNPAKEETWAWCSTDSCFYSFFEFVHSFIHSASQVCDRG